LQQFYDDTALLRMIIDDIAEQKKVSYEIALKLLYTSFLAKELSVKDSWYKTYSDIDLANMI